MKTAEPFSYKPPMTAVLSGIKYENGEAIFIENGSLPPHQSNGILTFIPSGTCATHDSRVDMPSG